MSIWYELLDLLSLPFLSMNFMKNALLAVLIMTPLFGILSTMVVTGRLSFFSDALGHSGFTGIAIGVLCGAASPTWFAVVLAVAFALLFSYVKSRTSQAAETIIRRDSIGRHDEHRYGRPVQQSGLCDRDRCDCNRCRSRCAGE